MNREEALVRRGIHWSQWHKVAEQIAASRDEAHLKDMYGTLHGATADLHRDGCMGLDLPLTIDVDFLRQWPRFSGHHQFSPGSKTCSHYPPDAILRTPGYIDLINDPLILAIVEKYLGCVPTIYSVNAWQSEPSTTPDVWHNQGFHRDTDDWKWLCLFVYLTDVDEESGPHQMIPGTHKVGPDGYGATFNAEIEEDYAGEIRTCTGKAGTCWLVDTLALHRGRVPRLRQRTVAWARYGFGPNTNSLDLEQGPLARRLIPTKLQGSPRDRYVNRLLFDWERGPI